MDSQRNSELSDHAFVKRLGLAWQSNEQDISPLQFEMSSEERSQDWKRISVWETKLTLDKNLRKLVPNPERKLVMKLSVKHIRNIQYNGLNPLNVKWDPLGWCIDHDGSRKEHYIPGCEGHSALDGMDKGNKKARKALRNKLAELAKDSECYFINRNPLSDGGSLTY